MKWVVYTNVELTNIFLYFFKYTNQYYSRKTCIYHLHLSFYKKINGSIYGSIYFPIQHFVPIWKNVKETHKIKRSTSIKLSFISANEYKYNNWIEFHCAGAIYSHSNELLLILIGLNFIWYDLFGLRPIWIKDVFFISFSLAHSLIRCPILYVLSYLTPLWCRNEQSNLWILANWKYLKTKSILP